MKKRFSFSLILISAAAACVAVTAVSNNALGLFKVDGLDHVCSGNHYAEKTATPTEAGHKEFWTCCTCHEHYLEEPVDGDWVEGTSDVVLHPTDDRYVAPAFVGTPVRIEAESTVLKGVFNSGDYVGKEFNANVIKADKNTIGNASNDKALWNFSTAGNTISMSVNSTSATLAKLTVGVARRKSSEGFDKWFKTEVNNKEYKFSTTITKSSDGGYWTITTVDTVVSLTEGANTIKFTVKDLAGNLDYFELTPAQGTLTNTTVPSFTLEPGTSGTPLLIEAEECLIKGTSSNSDTGNPPLSEDNVVAKNNASGGKCLNYFSLVNNTLSFSFYSDVAETVTLTVICAARKDACKFDDWFSCSLNSTVYPSNVTVAKASDFYTFRNIDIEVPILNGLNNFKLTVKSTKTGNLDAFRITPVNAGLKNYTQHMFMQ